ncbi:hypothetical protein [Actinocorallia longicatena]|uniref:DUF8128 domain-containing protein n=1 Tax=Actinocorallia longicatena TaxID=111803 RepID=A0ABP6QMQ8_9ACTN
MTWPSFPFAFPYLPAFPFASAVHSLALPVQKADLMHHAASFPLPSTSVLAEKADTLNHNPLDPIMPTVTPLVVPEYTPHLPTVTPIPAPHLPAFPLDKILGGPQAVLDLLTGFAPGTVGTLLLAAGAVAGGRSVLWWWRNNRLTLGSHVIEISVPPHVEPASAAAWWSHLAGLLHPWWKRWLFGQPHLAWEYLAGEDGVKVQVWVPGTISHIQVVKTIRSAWPGSTVTARPATPPIPGAIPAAGGRMVLARPDHYPLLSEHKNDPLRALLGAVEELGSGEHAAVQILVRPVTGRRLQRAHRAAAALRGAGSAAPQAVLFDLITPGSDKQRHSLAAFYPERAEQIRNVLTKAARPRFEVQVVYAAATSHRVGPAARGWLKTTCHEIASTFALYSHSGQFLRRRLLLNPAAQLTGRKLARGYLLSVDELAALAHLPYDLGAPGVARSGARPVAPTLAVPTAYDKGVRVLGDADAGKERTVAASVVGGRQHTHLLGQTGVGKSTLIVQQVLADARAGRGALVIDPKGDLINDILDRLPERAIGRTVVFDPAEDGTPSINVLIGPDRAFAVDAIVTTFHRCFSSAWGPRLDDLMRTACLTLAKVYGDGASLADLPALLTDDGYRAQTVARLKGKNADPLLKGFWASYDTLTPAGQAALISPVMNKLRAVLLRPFIREALCGRASTVDIGKILNSGGLILARAPKGTLGEDASRLFGSLLLAHTWQAMTPRANLPENSRRDVAAYVDEAHNFLNLPGSVSDILAEARGYRFSLTLAHQHLTQLPPDLREAVSADARNKIYFAASPEDAASLVRHVGPQLTPHDLSHLGAFQAVGRLMNGGAPTPAFTFRTRPLPDPIEGRQEEIRVASLDQFAPAPADEVPDIQPSAVNGATLEGGQA